MGSLSANPTFSEQTQSELDLRMAATKEAILMVECGAKEVSEDTVIAALDFGHKAMQPIIELQERMRAEIGKPKRDYEHFEIDQSVQTAVIEQATGPLFEILSQPNEKAQLDLAFNELRDSIVTQYAEGEDDKSADARKAFDDAIKSTVRQRILDQNVRVDGRGLTDVRPIWCKVEVSPRAHGSGLFTRGETQVLTLATLGTPHEARELDNLTPSESKRYMHHYNFPPFSVGETRFLRGASRREIGHGVLAERSLLQVIPPEAEFPYTLRLVSEVLSSNGSTSMASVCASTLALMDTGVPIKAPVAGVAMGLIKSDDGRYAILTDILGLEDHLGDMDFKVAGTTEGITALQMDIKIKGITHEVMSEALEQAREGRLHILDKMMETIPVPNPELKPHTPRITILKIPVDKIGAVIGPGGKTIRSIQDETKTRIDIQEDGSIFVASTDSEGENTAHERILSLTEVPEIGRIYTGKVVRITDFGAFVEILPNTDGMVHISQLDSERIERVQDVVTMGDEITVMVTDISGDGKIRLSRQAVLEGWTAEEARKRDRPSKSSRGRRNDRRQGGRR